MKCICLKFVSGEEIIGMLDGEIEGKPEYFNVVDPVKITAGYDTEGNFGIRLHGFMSYCEQSLFTFVSKDVIVYSEPTKQMIEYYQDYLGRKITVNNEELDLGMHELQSKSLH